MGLRQVEMAAVDRYFHKIVKVVAELFTMFEFEFIWFNILANADETYEKFLKIFCVLLLAKLCLCQDHYVLQALEFIDLPFHQLFSCNLY